MGETTIRHMRKDGSILDIRLDCNHRSGSRGRYDAQGEREWRLLGEVSVGVERTRNQQLRRSRFALTFSLPAAARFVLTAMMYFYYYSL